ncbi:uncharacterized protein EI90DRAFT_3054932 [Cantharellus anzutake]|uniref:uncharacterized protein n=1 Tax=Cantharellus anzutake TaxID=1750568 RepID=UPI0019054C5D|nr:uncharacterized protein EI90DRAFT_3054932 [Cantharellus anzutake]KAF8332299.1 hypothetical protein EI90DRAFT_3054932 [Cantharellus anzutake]
MADQSADIYLQMPVLTPDDTGSGYPAKITDVVVETTDVEKAQIDESDLHPSQKGKYKDHPEALELPKSHPWSKTFPLGLAFIAIAVGSEVLLNHTHNGIGFGVDLSRTGLSRVKQFWKSFGPSILFGPLFYWFTGPYVIALLKPFETNRMHHWAVFILSRIAISGSIFHALAGAYFEIVSVSLPQEVQVRIAGKPGLGYDNVGVTPFVDAAGVRRIGGLYSPFFLNDTNGNFWVVPDSAALVDPSDGDVKLPFRGLLVQARCAPVPSPVISGPDTANRYNITGTLSHNCSATSNVITNGTIWDGWMVPAPLGCVRSIGSGNNYSDPSDPRFSPVAFSFLKNTSSYSMVFCYSMIEEHDLTATLTLNYDTPFISDVVDRGNVSFLSWGPSGIGWPSNDPRVEGSGDAIRLALAGSIMNLAGDANYVAGLAEEAVKIFQATLAPSAFIVGPPYFRIAAQEVQANGLKAIPPVAHLITVLCAIIGSILIALVIHHFWWRKESLTNAAPSATTMAPAPAS